MSLAPAFLIGPTSRRRSLVAALLVASALVIPWSRLFATAPAVPLPPAAPTVRIVHLDDAGALIAEMTRHPHWQLQFGAAWWDCTSQGFTDVYTIDESAASIAWDVDGEPRRTLALTDGERDVIRGLGALSAAEPYDDDVVDREEQKYIVSFGDLRAGLASGATMEGARVGSYSPMGRALTDVVTAARARYVHARLAFVGEIRATLREYDEPTVAMKPGDLHDDELVDLADWALAHPGGKCTKDDFICAKLVIGDRHVEVGTPSGLPTPLYPLQRSYY